MAKLNETSSKGSDVPRWLEKLLSAKFFGSCNRHAALKKIECNIYCVDCCQEDICQHCLPDHAGHSLLQIRRYVYNDVVRLQDIVAFVDCSGVQTYLINNAKVVFLNQRPQSRPAKGTESLCETCNRGLQEPYRLCSVACKVDQLVRNGCPIAKTPPPAPALDLQLSVKAASPTSSSENGLAPGTPGQEASAKRARDFSSTSDEDVPEEVKSEDATAQFCQFISQEHPSEMNSLDLFKLRKLREQDRDAPLAKRMHISHLHAALAETAEGPCTFRRRKGTPARAPVK